MNLGRLPDVREALAQAQRGGLGVGGGLEELSVGQRDFADTPASAERRYLD